MYVCDAEYADNAKKSVQIKIIITITIDHNIFTRDLTNQNRAK